MTNASQFDGEGLTFRMNGEVAATYYGYEVGGTDLGPNDPNGFLGNCSLDRLFLGPNPGKVRLTNLNNNDGLAGPTSQGGTTEFLDVHGERKESFHFIVNAANAQYDSRITPGGEGDVDDSAWNAEWQSATRIGDKEWTAEIRIPYAPLGGRPPTDGTRWLVNFARNRAPLPGELSTWSFSAEKGFGNFAALVAASFGPGGAGKMFAGMVAPKPATVSADAAREPAVIPPLSKRIIPSELNGVRSRSAARKGEVAIHVSRPVGAEELSWPACGFA